MFERVFNAVPGVYRSLSIMMITLVAMGAAGCSGDDAAAAGKNANRTIPAVEAVQAREGALPLTQRLSGVVRARNQVEIVSEVSAVISAIEVENGEAVQRGQVLVRLRDREFRERLNQARAGYQIAQAQARQAAARLTEVQAELERTRALAREALVSTTELEAMETRAVSAEADFELAQARVAQAQATVAEREETLSQTLIRAPVAGTVGSRNAEVGMRVDSGKRLFTLGQLDNVQIEVVLTDKMLNFIEAGQRSEILLQNAASDVLSAPLSRISPFLHPVTHSTIAEIDMANSDGLLRPGMFVPVDIFYGESERATLVPLSALYEHPSTGITGVYISQAPLNGEAVGKITDGAQPVLSDPLPFEFVPVEVLARGRLEAGIRGVRKDDWVITIGQNLLGGQSGEARVRPVTWLRVERLQQLQRQDLMEEVRRRQKAVAADSGFGKKPNQETL